MVGAWFFCRIVVARFNSVLPVSSGLAAIAVFAGNAVLGPGRGTLLTPDRRPAFVTAVALPTITDDANSEYGAAIRVAA